MSGDMISDRMRKAARYNGASDGERQNLLTLGAETIEALYNVLAAIKWKSIDKDNMEFEAHTTCYQMDKIREALKMVKDD